MHKSVRIKFNPLEEGVEDKHIKVNLEQSTDTLELLSMKFDLKEAYQAFNSNYGVLVGRVIANDGIGVPNAKISVFIPLEEEDETESQIYRVYPYKSPRDKNNEGKRYNLLPRVAKYDSERLSFQPAQPFGSFPTKEEILTNDNILKVYKKYYKYTTITNDSGDYMIFGVPVGLHTVHLSLDITDIGKYSMNPASMITNLGYSPNFFTDNGTKLKPNNDLNDLPHIETQEISVDVIPFWGDVENFQIGITQQDFRVRAQLVNTVILFGSVFTDDDEVMWGRDSGAGNTNRRQGLNRLTQPFDENVSMVTKRNAKVTEKIYYYPNTISDADIDDGNVDDEGNDMLVLDPSEYSVYKRDGDFVFIINCNRRKVIIDEGGNEIVVSDDNPAGVFTEFRGFVTLEIDEDELNLDWKHYTGSYPLHPIRFRLKFPQYAERAQSHSIFRVGVAGGSEINLIAAAENTAKWRKQNKILKAGKFYSFARFHGTVFNDQGNYTMGTTNQDIGFINGEKINHAHLSAFRNPGILMGDRIGFDDDEEEPITGGTTLITGGTADLYNNATTVDGRNVFGANWLNFTVYLPQFGYLNPTTNSSTFKNIKSSTNFTQDFRRTTSTPLPANKNYYWDNNESIAAGQRNTKWFARSDLHWTDIIEVPLDDIIKLNEINNKGFPKSLLPPDLQITGTTYRNGTNVPSDWGIPQSCPMGGGRVNGNPANSPDNDTYFYKGFGNADCIQFLQELGLI